MVANVLDFFSLHSLRGGRKRTNGQEDPFLFQEFQEEHLQVWSDVRLSLWCAPLTPTFRPTQGPGPSAGPDCSVQRRVSSIGNESNSSVQAQRGRLELKISPL